MSDETISDADKIAALELRVIELGQHEIRRLAAEKLIQVLARELWELGRTALNSEAVRTLQHWARDFPSS